MASIKTYLDCVSPYSYYALLYLQKNRHSLASHGVTVEFIPVFLGGVNVGSGNKPPWELPAKKVYAEYDGNRAQKYFGVTIKTPDFFPILSLLPQRCMVYIKDSYPQDIFEAIFKELWVAMWTNGDDVSKPDKLANALAKHLPSEEVKKALAAASDPVFKKKLLDNTQEALDSGAFGCPWFVVTNKKGVKEPFFGSDRFHYMWGFLEIPFQDIEIGTKSKI